MIDRHLRPLIDPPLGLAGRGLARAGVSADAVSVAGMILGLLAGGLIALDQTLPALALILLSRLADGLDGAVARAGSAGSDFGGYLDIVSDFVFYAAIPLGFVLADPALNGAAGAFLLAAFYINGASFLGFATLAEKHRLTTTANGRKSFFHATGLLEGTETIALFVLVCLVPAVFAASAWVFGALCLLTASLRVLQARRLFRTAGPDRTAPGA
jgi:phosphatidylglycerophosphate synthase